MNNESATVVWLVLGFLAVVKAHEFHVGGEEGWLAHPSESFSHWAQRNRFHVFDRLVFEYNKAEDSVLVVSRQHYDECNIYDPYLRLFGGKSIFDLGRPGSFFFISGNQTRCELGEKMIITVMANRAPPPPSSHVSPPPPPPPSSPLSNSSRPRGTDPKPPPLSHHSSSSSDIDTVFSRVCLVIVGLVLGGAFLG